MLIPIFFCLKKKFYPQVFDTEFLLSQDNVAVVIVLVVVIATDVVVVVVVAVFTDVVVAVVIVVNEDRQ